VIKNLVRKKEIAVKCISAMYLFKITNFEPVCCWHLQCRYGLLTKQEISMIQATEMKFLRNIGVKTSIDDFRNEEVRKRV
jgi:hypothetical protein